MRIQLLDPNSDQLPDLLKSLYGLLMILPQTDAYKALRDRLERISRLHSTLNKIFSVRGKEVLYLKMKPSVVQALNSFEQLQTKHERII